MAVMDAGPAVALRDYQLEALAAIRAAAARGVRRQMLVMPTGTGKTIVFSRLIAERQDSPRGHRALVLAHRDELIQQAVEKLRMAMPGKPIGVVKAERYAGKLQTAASLAGVESFGAAGETEPNERPTLTEVMRQLGGLFKDPITGRMVALPVELFRSRQTAWVPGREGSWHLSTGQGFVALRPGGGRWSVVALDREGSVTQELAAQLDLGYAQGVAEDAVRAMGGWGLVDREAGWRRNEVSEKQLATLKRMRVPVPADRLLTKGEASDLITAAMAKRI